MCFLPVYRQKWAATASEGFLVSSAGERFPKHECNSCVSLLDSKTWNQDAANCRTEKWGKQPYPQLLGTDSGFVLSITISARQGCQSPHVMPLSKRVDGQRDRSLSRSVHVKSGHCLGVGQSGALLIQSKENKERWRDGGVGGRQTGRKSQKRGKRRVFKWDRNNVNRNKYKFFISMQRVFRNTRMHGVFGVLFFVLALFVFVKAFHLLAVTNQILQGEL